MSDTLRNLPGQTAVCLRRTLHLIPSEQRSLVEDAIHHLEATSPADQLLELCYSALYELGWRIELCGASVDLTNVVTLCSDLRAAIGNRWNPRDKYAEERVRAALAAAAAGWIDDRKSAS